MTNQDHHGVAQKTGERFHATDDVMKAQGSYGVAITEMSNDEFLEKDLQVHAYKTKISLCDHACASNFTFHNGTKF